MIFGLALSIGAVSQLTQKPGNLMGIMYSLLSFGFAFLILSVVWFRYSKVMSVLPVESAGVVAANMILLFLVSAEPYLYNLMTISSSSPSAGQLDSATTTALYALDFGALMIILAFFTYKLTLEDKHLIPRELMKSYWRTTYSTAIAAAIFILSALPIFWSVVIIPSPFVPLRYFMWGGVFIANMGRRLDVRMESRRAKMS
jgi:uncharacterized membrane protein